MLQNGKRRAYDSFLDFDEEIPTEAEAKEASQAGIEKFLELFEPVFQRNARFALRKPVPSIGSAETRIVHINNFYSYWVKFDSWRDFTNVDREHDPEQAQSREHKRWMQKENEKNAKKLKKLEMSRLNELVTRALAHDPRILADKARVKAEKAAQKEERQRKVAEEEREKAEKAKQLEEEQQNKIRNEKLTHEKARKQASKARNTFRKLLRLLSSLGQGDVGGEYGLMTADDCDLLCQSTETAELVKLNERMGGDAAVRDSSACVVTAVDDVLAQLQAVKKAIEHKRLEELKQTELRKKDHEKSALASSLKKKGVNREWTGEEFSMLSKGIRKFPAGTRQRWVTISNFMNDMLKPVVPYEKEECLQASQNAMKIMANLQESSVQKAPSQLLPPTSSAASTPATTTVFPVSKAALEKVAKPKSRASTTVSSADSKAKPNVESDSKSGKNNSGASNESEIWSQNEQKLLENGLKKYPASMDKNERWSAIAADIPGKSKKDCILRFKNLREELQASKTKK